MGEAGRGARGHGWLVGSFSDWLADLMCQKQISYLHPACLEHVDACLDAPAGVAHGAFDNELEALAGLRDLLSFLPLSNRDKLRRVGGMCSTLGRTTWEGSLGRKCVSCFGVHCQQRAAPLPGKPAMHICRSLRLPIDISAGALHRPHRPPLPCPRLHRAAK